jgi:hypothetical protein
MPESELASKITRVIKSTDKLVRDVKKGVAEVTTAVIDLRTNLKPGDDEKPSDDK